MPQANGVCFICAFFLLDSIHFSSIEQEKQFRSMNHSNYTFPILQMNKFKGIRYRCYLTRMQYAVASHGKIVNYKMGSFFLPFSDVNGFEVAHINTIRII